jgi:hypothetical protein
MRAGKNFEVDLTYFLGWRFLPWLVQAYLLLLVVCAILMIFAMIEAGPTSTANDAAHQVLTLSIDSFKIVIGAVIGSLSMAANQNWRGRNSRSQRSGAPQGRDDNGG